MSNKIKIGISAKFHVNSPAFYGGEVKRHIQYLETSIASWVAESGALPFLIPSESVLTGVSEHSLDSEAFAAEMDALVLQGGSDIVPSLYGEEDSGNILNADIARDLYELKLVKEFLKLGKPIFGICRGLQLLNVYFGGTLHQDLEVSGFAKHLDRELEKKHQHTIQIQRAGFLSRYYDEKQVVTSLHHQGIKKIGEHLSVEALSDDGLIEAFSKIDREHFVMAVQWHPEFHSAQEAGVMDSGLLFKLFLKAAHNRKFYGHHRIRPDLLTSEKPDSKSLSLGVELELQLINKETRNLEPCATQLLEITTPQTTKIKTEIFQSMIEVETGICKSAHEVETDLKQSLSILYQTAEQMGIGISSTGTHPFALYSERKLTESERYQYLFDTKQWIARRIAIFGLHCHVGASSEEEAAELYRLYLSLSPLLLALSASSPFFQGEETGLCSVRSTFFESTPAGGHPPIFKSWQEFEGMLAKLYKSKTITSHKDLWWDVRPSLTYGTIEIRICDMLPKIEDNIALIALVHLLGYAYLKNKDKFTWPHLTEWSYRENKWRALRYGMQLEFITNDAGDYVNGQEYLAQLLTQMHEEIAELKYEKYIGHLLENMLAQSPAEKIMKVYAESNKNLNTLVDLSMQDFADFFKK